MLRWPLSLAFALVLLLAAAAPSGATVQTKTFDYPIDLKPLEVEQEYAMAPSPKVDGHIIGMNVDVVDPDGSPVPIQRMMLHHIVFLKVGDPNPNCGSTITGFDSKPTVPNIAKPFYAAGEERQVFGLPEGYGIRTGKDDTWVMSWMLMNHRTKSDRAMIRYTVTWDDSPDMKRVEPIWLDVKNCNADPVYDVPGGGKAGAIHERTFDYVAPTDGRIVAGGGHLHGGGKEIAITQPECSNREVFTSKPAWGMPDHPFYTVKPILHEPGPISMSGWLSREGHPVKAGQRVRITSRYDNTRPHTRVMGIAMAWFAPGEVSEECAPAPSDAQYVQTADLRGEKYRTETPKFTVPLTGFDSRGRLTEIKRPPGKTRRVRSGTTVRVEDTYFSIPNASVARGARLRWRFGPDTLHNVTLANGPRGFSSPNLNDGRKFDVKFKAPGTYRLFCTLHPVSMTQTVQVR